MVAQKTHYEVLEISKDAELIDIKKAYRRLALKHHPDRNNGSAESTEKFKEISQAYTILSDPTTRRDYDASLRSTPQTSMSATPYAGPSQQRQPTQSQHKGVRDPFQQFDDLFRNDPFFQEAFQDMDDAFAKRFDNSQDKKRDNIGTSDDNVGPLFFCGIERPRIKKQPAAKKVPWSQWLMNKLGIEFEMTSYSHQADGSVLTSAYNSKPTGTYTNKKSRTYVEEGRQVTIMSMEKDGNKIEDKLIAGKLVERKVNGKVEQITQQVAN
mmetsp:Transcript_5680/g.12899  ORF Transcript_5680/g.12899 Transcript_5680/m.12899 type:complete len:268 (-) Transcript_5680:326-1129(-)|eukprot:CAMPEP_0172320128 /NCGR_PEP_ID=MMETSP1058-20130122/39702_1 /TAXON_ID=83371 /ORGANISM="Detonula confervacea, Strain CCMP 353" /LENGTH=267 /DNA_ID=CAMNT_0013035323 /DNA_START=78 /DNA_END=881 /DNA_ORIENTATION=-